MAAMLARQANREREPAQFIVTTFHPQIVGVADKIYGVSHTNRLSRWVARGVALLAQHADRGAQGVGVACDRIPRPDLSVLPHRVLPPPCFPTNAPFTVPTSAGST